MNFEWDEAKATANFRKHKVTFEDASTIFEGHLSLTGRDPDHSLGEHRFITLGVSAVNRILVVSHAERGDLIRIISARFATRLERKMYEEG